MKKKITPVNYIAVSNHTYSELSGRGETIEQAIEKLQEAHMDYDGEHLTPSDILIYSVQRYGKAKIAIDWVSE